MKILSFNVRIWTRDKDKNSEHYWRNRMEKMKEMIESYNPDVICFQELMYPANKYIPKNYRRVNISFQHPIYVRKGYKTKKHKFRIHMDSVIVNDEYQIMSIHSHWNPKILKRNLKQIERITNTDKKVIICGDFNNSEDKIMLQNFRHIDYPIPQDTFINFKRPTTEHGIIDHFYTKNLFGEYSVKIITEYDKISDHYPIIFEF